MKNTKLRFVVVMAVVLTAVSANAGVIVAENFGGSGSGGLNGTTADTFYSGITAAGGSATWGAGTGILDNGVFNTTGSTNQKAAYLNMGSYINNAKGAANGLFKLTMTISPTTGVWISLGFGQENTPGVDRNFTNSGSGGSTNGLGTIIYRAVSNPGELDMFGGLGSANTVDGPDGNTGSRTLTVTLDLTPSGGYNGSSNYGKVTWSDSVLGVLGSYTYTTNYTFKSILITEANGSTGTISNLTLKQEGYSPYSPDPSSGETLVEVSLSSRLVPGAVSWQAPGDPNAAVLGYNLYMDPNQTKIQNATPSSTGLAFKSLQSGGQTGTSFDPGINLNNDTTYYWRVDAVVDYDYIPGSDPNIVTGAIWSFTTIPLYMAPQLAMNSVTTAVDLLPASISAAVTQNTNPITSVIFTLLTDDYQFPAGAAASVTNTTTNNQNPTATFTTNMAGTYKVKLEVSDGTTTVEKLMKIAVYTDACAAKKAAPSGWTANYYDRDGDCKVDLNDFADMAEQWLNNTSLTAPETYPKDVVTIPLAVYNARIEAENPRDPSACSNPPITDTTGIQIYSYGVGSAAAGEWVEYTVNVAAAGTYDVYVLASTTAAGRTLSFGTSADADAYGVVTVTNTGNWNTFAITKGSVTFTSSGAQTLRITWNGGINLDWFAF